MKRIRRISGLAASLIITCALLRAIACFSARKCRGSRILVGVFTSAGAEPTYVARRTALLATWFPQQVAADSLSCEQGITVRFVVGRPTGHGIDWKQELDSGRENFMVLDIVESYHNLAAKTAAFFRAAAQMGRFDYVLKVDDDVFLSTQRLDKAVDQWSKMEADYVGCMKQPYGGADAVFSDKRKYSQNAI